MATIDDKLLLECLEHLLRPMVRFCLRRGLRLQAALESLKNVFLEVATEELEKKGIPVTESKLSIMTGVHRPDVARICREGGEKKTGKNEIARVIGYWHQSQQFRTANGKPRTLSFESGRGEFADLVSSVSGALNPHTVLFELERVGAVKRTPQGISLKSRLYIPKGNLLEGFQILYFDIEDLTVAVEENLFEERELNNLHLRTEYDSIPASAEPEIRDWILKEGSAFHAKVRNFLAKFDSETSSKGKGSSKDTAPSVRVMLGSFSRVEPVGKAAEPKDQKSGIDDE